MFLEGMEQVVPWAQLCLLIEPHYPKPGNGRRPNELQAKGVRITTGTIVDATLIHIPFSTKKREQSRDPVANKSCALHALTLSACGSSLRGKHPWRYVDL
jgi:hypothetical protein